MKKSIVILSVTSDIGLYIAKYYYNQGYKVYGTYRKKESLASLKKDLPEGYFFQCDAQNRNSIDTAAKQINKYIESWNILVSCPCSPLPLQKFNSSNINEWEDSFYLNSLAQLRFLHRLIPTKGIETHNDHPLVLFFAGGGTNNAVDSFSAYTSAKIHLIKMFELLAFEDQLTKYCIIGPGWTNTKTHYITLENTNTNSKKHKEVSDFIKDPSNATPLIDIVNCIEWIRKQKLKIVSGRNFSVVNDNWKGKNNNSLVMALEKDENMYKLRRSGNNTKFDQ